MKLVERQVDIHIQFLRFDRLREVTLDCARLREILLKGATAAPHFLLCEIIKKST